MTASPPTFPERENIFRGRSPAYSLASLGDRKARIARGIGAGGHCASQKTMRVSKYSNDWTCSVAVQVTGYSRSSSLSSVGQ